MTRAARIARRLLGAACHPDVRADVLRDLDEEYAARRGHATRADAWVVSQVIRSIAPMALDRIRAVQRRKGRELPMQTTRRWFPAPTWLDLRTTLRQLGRRPGFAAAAILIFALGIGADTAVFSVAYNVLFKPLPYRAPHQLVAVWPGHFFSNAELAALRAAGGPFDALPSIAPGWNMALTGAGDAAQISVDKTSTDVFGVLGVAAELGRTFVPDEGRTGGDRVIVLSHDLWQARFGADRSVLGRTIQLDGDGYRVVGVMPAGFAVFTAHAQAWVPLAMDPAAWYHKLNFSQAFGRVRDGASIADARLAFGPMLQDVKKTLGLRSDYGRQAGIVPLRDAIVGDYETKLVVLVAGAGVIVLLAGANVGGLLVSRALSRRRELALRLALGAARRDVTLLLLTESAILAGLGGVAGLAMAWGGLGALVHMLPPDTPRLDEIRINAGVLAGAAAVTLGAALVAGLVPIVLMRKTDLQAFLRSTLARRSTRARTALVIAQVALAVLLLSGAVLMGQTLWNLSRVDLGFSPEDVVTFRVQPAGGAYATGAGQNDYYDALFTRLSAVPDVRAVGAIQHLPLGGSSWVTPVQIQGRVSSPGDAPTVAQWRYIRGDYFSALGIRLESGRAFDETERSTDPVVIVNNAFVRRWLPDGSALGRRVRLGTSASSPWRTIVGVVADVRHSAVSEAAEPELYQPHRPPATPDAGPAVALSIAVRVTPGRDRMADIAGAARRVDPNVPVAAVERLNEAVARSLGTTRMLLTLLGAFALCGVLLSAVGVYGIVAYTVAQRSREFAVRLALGETPAGIAQFILRYGLQCTLAGVTIGVIGALAATRLMHGVLFGVTPTNVPMLATITLTLTAIGLAASALPARAALRRNPIEGLRES